MRDNIIKDPIYSIAYWNESQHEIIKPIIDSPVFQRLKGIKQLGLVDVVFPSATHTRFSHSIGTCHLALRIAKGRLG